MNGASPMKINQGTNAGYQKKEKHMNAIIKVIDINLYLNHFYA